jgi:hypothetical protein
MHRFEDKDNFTRQLLQQEAYLLKVHLISAFQELNFIFGDRGPQSFGGINGSISEQEWEITEVLADSHPC